MNPADVAAAATTQPQTVQILIAFDPTTGSTNVSGPLDNAILMYGLLELAKEAYRNHLANKANEQRVTPVRMMPGFPPRS